MGNLRRKINYGINRTGSFLKWILIVLIVLIVDTSVIANTNMPDWTLLFVLILVPYTFIRWPKIATVIINLFLAVVIFVAFTGVDASKEMLYEFYLDIGADIIAWAIVIGIGYLFWKGRKR